jgi:hypothetical protein
LDDDDNDDDDDDVLLSDLCSIPAAPTTRPGRSKISIKRKQQLVKMNFMILLSMITINIVLMLLLQVSYRKFMRIAVVVVFVCETYLLLLF